MDNTPEISIKILQDTTDNFGVFHVEQNQLDIKIEQESNVVDMDVAIIEGVSGLTHIAHTADLTGNGTPGAPLGISDDFKHSIDNKQDKLTPGPGISIEDDVISVVNGFTYEQGVASDTWVINHNLGRNPVVVVIDTSGNVVYPSVHYDNLNTCTITMNYAFKGTAYLN